MNEGLDVTRSIIYGETARRGFWIVPLTQFTDVVIRRFEGSLRLDRGRRPDDGRGVVFLRVGSLTVGLSHVSSLNEGQLRHVMRWYVDYRHVNRIHLGPDANTLSLRGSSRQG